MILFDLVCSKDHGFEGWFKSSEAYEAQSKKKAIACPVCGDTKTRKALNAPALLKGTGGKSEAIAIKVREALGELRRQVEANCDYVGDKFPEEARRIHYGETKRRPVYGEATSIEAGELREEGIDVVAIPWPERQDS